RTDDGHMQGVHGLGDYTLVFLDTLDGPPYRDGHHAGRLCPARMRWADRAIAAAPGPVVIFMHHPPYAVGFPGMDDIRLADDEAFLAMLSRHGPGKVAHVLSGHVHRTISGNVGGISVSLLKSTCHQMPMLLGARGSGHSVAEPGAYGIVLLGPRSVIVHSEDFDIAGTLPVGDHDSGEGTRA
ncbi:MAG: phosphodiesterase, partial [Alphaproteobacteria bacterium]